MFGAGVLATALVAAHIASATLYTDIKQLPTSTFDFVIIGGRLHLFLRIRQDHLTLWS